MKRLLVILIALSFLPGCRKDGPSVEDFTFSPCISTYSEVVSLSLLDLKYENGDLRVTRSDAWLNCSLRDRGLACSVSVRGNDIYYKVDYEKEGQETNCNCLIENMTSLVKGLQEGRRYSFHYYCCGNYIPFYFVFEKGLVQIVDVSTLLPQE